MRLRRITACLFLLGIIALSAWAAFPTVSSATGQPFGADTTDHNVTMPATVNAGDLLIVLFTNDGGGQTVATPVDWNQLFTTPNGASTAGVRHGAYYKIAAGTEGGTTVNFVTSDTEHAVSVTYRITAWHGTTPPEAGTSATGTR